MHIALIADAYPPDQNSAAVQLRDLSKEFVAQGYDVLVIRPSSKISSYNKMDIIDGVQVLSLYAPNTKEPGYFRRTINEILMPIFMVLNFLRTAQKNKRLDAVVWYSPSIFHGFFVHYLKLRFQCKAYLIIRDIFPEWAADLRLMRRGLPYHFFKIVANYQYYLADTIGVQTYGNLKYFGYWSKSKRRIVEVLPNWLGKPDNQECALKICDTKLAGRKIFVYAGNIGIAQGMDILLDLAHYIQDRSDIGFLFVGRGSEKERLKEKAINLKLDNTIFFDEILPEQIPNLYNQCYAGLVCLSSLHKTHNIPGKFLTYLQSGLPCFAIVNGGNDLSDLIDRERVGKACESDKIADVKSKFDNFLSTVKSDKYINQRCRQTFEKHFSVENIVVQIVNNLEKNDF